MAHGRDEQANDIIVFDDPVKERARRLVLLALMVKNARRWERVDAERGHVETDPRKTNTSEYVQAAQKRARRWGIEWSEVIGECTDGDGEWLLERQLKLVGGSE